MVKAWLRSWLSKRIRQPKGRPDARGKSSFRGYLPRLEVLEDRLTPTDYTWTPTAAGTFSWTNPANWSGGPAGTYPSSAGDTADLTSPLVGNETVNLPASTITIGTLSIGATSGVNTFTVATAGGSLTATSITKTNGGEDIISAPINLASATTLTDSSARD